MTHLTRLIKRRREELETSQLRLGKLLGFENGQFISNIERSNNIQYPPIYFRKLAKILKLDINLLINEARRDFYIWIKKEVGK